VRRQSSGGLHGRRRGSLDATESVAVLGLEVRDGRELRLDMRPSLGELARERGRFELEQPVCGGARLRLDQSTADRQAGHVGEARSPDLVLDLGDVVADRLGAEIQDTTARGDRTALTEEAEDLELPWCEPVQGRPAVGAALVDQGRDHVRTHKGPALHDMPNPG